MKCQALAKYQYQRGVIGLAGILILLIAVIFTALVVDSGRLWMQQRQLQSIADIAAINASRQLGCSPSIQNVIQMAQQAAVANGYVGQLSNSPNQVLLGRLNTVQGIRQFNADGSGDAVYVKSTRVVPKSLVAGGLFGGTLTLHAEAVSAADPPWAAFGAGSFNANLSSEQSTLLNGLLGGMMGTPLNLDVLTYRGISGVRISLQDMLAVSGQLGTFEDLLNTNIPLGNMLDMFANAALQNGTADLQAVSAMQTIASHVSKNTTLKLGDVLAVTTPDARAAASVGLNALSMITTALMIANGKNAVNLPLAVSIPTIASINAQVTIVEPPQIAVGPAAENGNFCTVMRTAQIKTRVGVLVSIPLLARIDFALSVAVAQGSAGLRGIQQSDGMSEVKIEANPGVAALALTNNAGTGPARISTLLNIPIADISLNLPVQPPVSQTLDYSVYQPTDKNLPQTQSIASPLGSSLKSALSQSSSLKVTVLSVLNLGLVNNVVSNTISPLLAEIGRVLLDPLLGLLGIRVGGMDVTLDDLQYRQDKPLSI